MGAATFSYISNRVADNKREVLGTINLSSSYATGGDSLNLTTQGAGLSRVDFMSQMCDSANTRGLSFVLAGTPEAPLIKVYDTNNSEIASATNLATRGTATVRLSGS
jgi:hypothetical protein